MSRVLLPWALLIAAATAPLWLSGYDLNLLGRFLASSIVAMGLVVLWGHGGVLSLGQGVFFGLGGYAIAMHATLARLGDGVVPDFMLLSGTEVLPWWWTPLGNPLLAVMAVIVVPALMAGLLGWAVFRRGVSGVYFALITQALALAFATFLVSEQAVTGGFNGLTNFPTLFGVDTSDDRFANGLYWTTLGIVVFTFAGLRWLLGARFGLLLRATRDAEKRVRFLGYGPAWFKVAALALAGALSGVAGALFTLHAGVVSPAMVGVVPSIEMVVWVALGGRLSLPGAITAAVGVNFARDAISSAFPELWLYVVGALFVMVVTSLPTGLAGLAGRWSKLP